MPLFISLLCYDKLRDINDINWPCILIQGPWIHTLLLAIKVWIVKINSSVDKENCWMFLFLCPVTCTRLQLYCKFCYLFIVSRTLYPGLTVLLYVVNVPLEIYTLGLFTSYYKIFVFYLSWLYVLSSLVMCY